MENYNFNKFLFIGVFMFAIIFGLINIYSYIYPSDKFEKFRGELLTKVINHKVDRIFVDSHNHSATYAIYQNDSIQLFGSNWVNLVKKGDSIIKLKGSLKMTIIKPNGNSFVLDYENSFKEYH
jgi:hypothetical protein